MPARNWQMFVYLINMQITHVIIIIMVTVFFKVMHCVELTKRVRAHDSASKVTANAAHPGAVNSEFIRYPWFTKFVKPVVSPLLWYFLVSFFKGGLGRMQ
jgi:predicted membrane protein